jgi:CRP-like cAMP-binding protein
MAKDVILEADLGGQALTAEEIVAIPAFSTFKVEILKKFPGAMARKTFAPGEIIFREGEYGTTAFFIENGTVEVHLQGPAKKAKVKPSAVGSFFSFLTGIPQRDKKQRPKTTHIPANGYGDLPLNDPIARLEQGEIFGEMSALAVLKQERSKRPKYYPRTATVRAQTPVTVVEMLPNILNNILFNSPAFKEKLNTNYRTRALDTHLRSVPALQSLTPEFREYLRGRVELKDFQPGEALFKQGDVAEGLYLIRLGFVKVSQDFPGGELVLTYLSRGSYLGEMGLLPPAYRVRVTGNVPGQITEGAVAEDSIVCGRAPSGPRTLAIPWDEYISREHFQLQGTKEGVRATMLAKGKNPLTYNGNPAMDFVVKPGEEFECGSTSFQVIADKLQSGRQPTTCTAMDFVQVVVIKPDDFELMLQKFPEIRAEFSEVARARRQQAQQSLSRVSTVSLTDYLDQDLMQGQNMLLLDLDKCTRCDECSKACAATHEDGIPRVLRDGHRFDKYLVATSCRACLDPLCMTRCPVGSIRRKESLDIVIEDWCIGCNNCAEECPFGSITITEPNLLQGYAKVSDARPKATVCDLCHEYEEPNCVRACPHDAAIRVDPRQFFARELAGIQLAIPVEPTPTASLPVAADANMPTQIISNAAALLNMLPKVRIQGGQRDGAVLQLRVPQTTFGRTPENDYSFPEDNRISRLHCIIRVNQGRYTILDNNSTNGTFIDGEPVIGERDLRPGQMIEIGEIRMVFEGGSLQ